ncbi:hypothetical protein J2Y83_002171 [Pseudomonas marginalis]|nr:hypothetical protein [Pseudomonas marginalis]MCP1523702.1 hypothetical protein [Pseudomonas marginalis]
MTDPPLSGASPLSHFDLHGSDRTRSALALGRGLIANLILQAELGQKCGRGLAPDSSVSVTTCMTDPPLSGASPLSHFDLHGSDRTRSALALGRGLIANLILQAELGQKCGRGLAPDSSVSVTTCMTDPPLSGASPLPHFDLRGSDRTRSALALALGRGLISDLILQAELGQKCGRGLAPDGSVSVTTCMTDPPLSGASPLSHFDLHGSDRTRSALALGRGLIANLILQAELGQKCGRGLAPDSSVSVTTCMTDPPLSGASPLSHFDLHGSDRTRSALALGRGLIANLILQAELGQKCGRGLAPDSSVSVTTCMTDPPLSGASPLPHFDLRGSDRTRSALALALGRGLISDLILQAELGQKCGRGLAPDGSVSVTTCMTDPPLSGASPLPHFDLHGSDRPHSGS